MAAEAAPRPLPMPLLETVPNLSEGRSGPALGRILSSMATQSGAHLLDASADLDHNRAVLTLAGEGSALVESLRALYVAALQELDLRDHRGVHPRFGVVDVAPVVPLSGSTMTDAVAAAERLAESVAGLGLPVFLYGEAARQPARRDLPALRRELGAAMAAESPLQPDVGPPTAHPTGGVAVIGARPLLVAFNVLLADRDVAAARAIARRVRERGDGLPGVRALGLELASRDRAQVSMNLFAVERTGLAAAWEAVARAADEEGVGLGGCEIVGLVPEVAASGFDPERSGLEGSLEERLLEPRLRRLGLL